MARQLLQLIPMQIDGRRLLACRRLSPVQREPWGGLLRGVKQGDAASGYRPEEVAIASVRNWAVAVAGPGRGYAGSAGSSECGLCQRNSPRSDRGYGPDVICNVFHSTAPDRAR